jgi:hypothetical protein
MDTVLVEVVAPMLSVTESNSWGSHLIFDYLGLNDKARKTSCCEYPEDWTEAVRYVSEWIGEISHLYRHRIRIRWIDAQSPLGLWKQLRYRLFKFPAFIVDKKLTYIGWDYKELEILIDERIHRGR